MDSRLVAIRLCALALLTVGSTACPPPPKPVPPPDVAQPLTVNELCRIYLSRIDNSDLFESPYLCYHRQLAAGSDYTDAEVARDCRPGTSARAWVDELYQALQNGHVKMDWKLARECLDKSRELRRNNPGYALVTNPDWKALEEGACKTFVQGNVADGEQCRLDWECMDGSGCYATDGFDESSRRCMPPATVDERCSDYRPCDAISWCDSGGTCVAKAEDNQPCVSSNYGDDCLSGTCTGNLCAPATVLKSLGEECSVDEDGYNNCDGSAGCITCGPDSEGGPFICRVLGGIGAYCRDRYDCAGDLGCNEYVCSAEPAGAACSYSYGTTTELVCGEGLYCLPKVPSCSQYATPQQCNSQTPDCGWDSDYETCDWAMGQCYTESEIPTSGACLNGFICFTGSYCRPSDGTCQPLAGENEACSDDGTAGAPCGDLLVCVENVCRTACDYNEDCQAGYYCSDDYTCQPLAPTACDDDTMCPTDFYCVVPEDPCDGQEEHICSKLELCKITPDPYCNPVGDCDSLTSATACGANAECVWISAGSSPFCDNKCRAHDEDQTACLATATCSWYVDAYGYTYCISECLYLWNDEAACRANTACVFETEPLCELKAPIGSCERKLAVGEPCTDSTQCLSGDCATDANGDDRCAVALTGCNRDVAFIRSAFLLGLVFLGARGLRRRRKA
ncbi:MAG: hypothetical protein JXR83_15865 [Deltaproteobacteria bacterium]|nr:hypothetical protein [Deltaproteobacteria bacterium]